MWSSTRMAAVAVKISLENNLGRYVASGGAIFLGALAGLGLTLAQAATTDIVFSQSPNRFIALEGTAGNIGFINASNVGTVTAQIDRIGIEERGFDPYGELDDEATNVELVAPNPTALDPFLLFPGSNFNVKFSWDAVDIIRDNDEDVGVWPLTLLLYDDTNNVVYQYSSSLEVTDYNTPLPAALPLFATGLGAMGLFGWRRKRKNAAAIAA